MIPLFTLIRERGKSGGRVVALALTLTVPPTRGTYLFGGCILVGLRCPFDGFFQASVSVNECPYGANPAYPERLRYRSLIWQRGGPLIVQSSRA